MISSPSVELSRQEEFKCQPSDRMESTPGSEPGHSPHSFPFINGTFLDEVPCLARRRAINLSGWGLSFISSWPQLSASHPPRCQVLVLCQVTSKTQRAPEREREDVYTTKSQGGDLEIDELCLLLMDPRAVTKAETKERVRLTHLKEVI